METKTVMSTSELKRPLRHALENAVEEYLLFADRIFLLQKAQKEIREKKILPLQEKLGMTPGTKIEGAVVDDDEEREWYVSLEKGAARLDQGELLKNGVDIEVIEKSKKRGKPSLKVAWKRKGKSEEEDEE